MYAVMKAMRETTLTPTQFIANYDGTPGVEWYNGTGEYADALVANQSSNGHWNDWVAWDDSGEVSTDLSTAWGVLILEFVPVRVTYSLTVIVVDAATNNPIGGAAVQAVGPETDSGNTGSNGNIKFPSVQAGSYQISVSATGYTPGTATVSVTSNTVFTIALQRPTPPQSAPQSVGGYSISFEKSTPTGPFAYFGAFVAAFGAVISLVKRKKKRETRTA